MFLAGLIPVGSFLLGVWQVKRWRWKLQLIEELEEKVREFPAEISESAFLKPQLLDGLEYRKLLLHGKFDYSKEILMGLRPLVNYNVDTPPGKGFFNPVGSAPSGYHVITPFVLQKTGLRILVNRGWISERNPRKYKSTEDTVEIIAVYRKGEHRSPFMPKHDGRSGILQYRDIPLMAQLLGTEEQFVDLYSIRGIDLTSARLHSLPVPNQTRITLRNEHVSYFCTWFSLSAITGYMWFRRFILKKPLR